MFSNLLCSWWYTLLWEDDVNVDEVCGLLMDYGNMESLDYSEKYQWWFHHYESNEVTKTYLFALMMDMEMLESGEQMVHYQGEVVVEQKNDENMIY